jgi:hypothetical protein
MNRRNVKTIAFTCFASSVLLGAAWQALAQDANGSFPSMAPVEQYLMADRNAEIALARSAAPESIARDAEVMILGPHGYETAIKGTSGFVCIVERSWMLPYDDPAFWDPKVRLPLCVNPPAARSHLPLTFHQAELALSGMPKPRMFDKTKAAFDKKELPLPEPGSMCYMMSKQQNFGPKYGNADPHLMFWFPQKDRVNWGADFPGSPIDVHQYSPQPITEFDISVSKWSDGSPAP